jgi:hypothetical protein
LDLLDYQKKETIKELSDSCLTLLTEINKIYKPKKVGMFFKMTTDVISASIVLSKPVETKENFKEFKRLIQNNIRRKRKFDSDT